MMPIRIQRKRTKGWKMPPNTVYVGRGTEYGNAFNKTQIAVTFGQKGYPMPLVALHTEPSLERCLDMYIASLFTVLSFDPEFLAPLKGRNLACWCKEGEPCHADILLKLANEW